MDKSTRYKIFNDPVHGFITVPKGIVLQLIDHPYVQRLRRIRQMGLGYLVFPSGEHSRFSHALGALELMQRILNNLREKDTTISRKEFESALIAILLHDVGHGPLSHTLEHTFIEDFDHEKMTLAIMKRLNREFDGKLEQAIKIFTGKHEKAFLHQLVSSQLDMDRLDYLKRDSFHTGVHEGSVGIDRIIKTMRVFRGQVVIEQKGIYAIENYILSRRLMYMQVYLHKTVLAADALLKNIFTRVRELIGRGHKLFYASPSLRYFLEKKPSAKNGLSQELVEHYVALDDDDVFLSIKYWQDDKDPVLADLCTRFMNRSLFRTTFWSQDPTGMEKDILRERTRQYLKDSGLPYDDQILDYYILFDQSYSEAYRYERESIWILKGQQDPIEFSQAADTENIIALAEPVIKPYVVHLKDIETGNIK